MKTLIKPTWNGTYLTSIVEIDNKKFKTKVGLANGGGIHSIYILGGNGWEQFLTATELNIKKTCSYVSDEHERKEYATTATKKLVQATKKVFE